MSSLASTALAGPMDVSASKRHAKVGLEFGSPSLEGHYPLPSIDRVAPELGRLEGVDGRGGQVGARGAGNDPGRGIEQSADLGPLAVVPVRLRT